VRIEDALLYLVVDLDDVTPDRAAGYCREAISAGVDVVQLRAEGPGTGIEAALEQVAEVCRADDALLIVAGVPDTAARVRAAGMHFDALDQPIGYARAVLGQGALAGMSARTIAEATLALSVGADYLVFHGGIESPSILAGLPGIIGIPVFAAGITSLADARQITSDGLHRLCIENGVIGSDNVREGIAEFSRLVGRCV